ncbi:MAG: LCP family protein, partial [Paenibacillus macerans]|nr:LCP family protein [Paenibacillus macerans]
MNSSVSMNNRKIKTTNLLIAENITAYKKRTVRLEWILNFFLIGFEYILYVLSFLALFSLRVLPAYNMRSWSTLFHNLEHLPIAWDYGVLLAVIFAIYALYSTHNGLYKWDRDIKLIDDTFTVCKAVFFSFLIALGLIFFLQTGVVYSRLVILSFAVMIVVCAFVSRLLRMGVMLLLKRTDIYSKNVLIIGAGAYVFRKPLAIMAFDLFLSGQVEKQLQESYAPLGGETEPQQVAQEQGLEPFTMLLLGVDQRDKEPARSDTMIYAVVRPEEEKVLLISIPRDTYTEIVGKGSMDKINHAYAFGGEKMAKDTVENLLGYPADYYAAINFHGLREIVDALGGIELPITKDIVNKEKYHEKFTIKAGKPLYSGEEALNYVRYREDSDFERTKRHQVFLNAMVNRMLKLDQVTKIPELMN